ncbi:DNA-3-methyladenine glycosylase 2 family protein [Halovenus sp. WSH3]|uniref:DNA-3-methyladenine glycosylase 2 family protein n=1 Tax=Halovenus carboxidivorans TaxID=2692199 RepID=A0A6B0T9L7_9EURY|nr:DNA-3-methyladenine glycosylase 2 family protein [Halovenus carboxidivorans]MXR51560.1 DNA-3-methyladenine glycosylase 2 family protein [Halovenus carboxidivorans]
MHEEAATALAADPALQPHVEEHGPLELDPAEDTFERLVVSLLRQQVSTDAAAAIRERLFDAVEVTPSGILAADEATLRDAGLSEAKTGYVRAVAEAYQREGYDRAYFEGLDDEAVADELTEIRGVGPWTAKMFLMFALGRPDVFPVEDLGIRRGIELVCDREMSRGEMRDRAAEWAPYRSYASLYLWRAYEG